MAGFIDEFMVAGAKFEKPVLVSQVEKHLIFGPMARLLPFGYVALFGGACVVFYLMAHRRTATDLVGDGFNSVCVVSIAALILLWTRRQQAILGWIATKGALGIAALMLASVGAGISFYEGRRDAWANLFLGLIWIPGVEFIPKVAPHQRYVTAMRIALTIPCVYFGIRSGNWTW